jgi:mannose-1-phosphate guanylyltransferase
LAAQHEVIVTLGIQPTFPATGYGYIQQGEKIGEYAGLEAFGVRRFAEKPDQATAEAYLQQGNYWWNGGIFVFRAGVMLRELGRFAPQILGPLKAKGREAYAELPKKSLDYAVMEHTDKACVIPASFGWDDLGDWNALERLLGSTDNLELARHVGLDTHGSILYTTGNDIIVTLGLENVLIVRDGPVTLIVKKERSQDIKKVLEALRRDPELARHL